MRAALPLLFVAVCACTWACATAEGKPKSSAPGPVVIELFTSQGCSSCPPADRLLSRLARAGSLSGRPLAPLSFHVDYWNDLGWSDPYSRPMWTERQHAYARALGDRSVYTPQIVIGGSRGMVGSKSFDVKAAIRMAPAPALLPAKATWSDTHLEVTTTAPPEADVLVAIWEDGRRIEVTRGENSGKTLGNDRVVRRLERVARAGKPGTIRVELDPSWHAVGAVVFAQRADKRIVASALLPH